jgi:uncharacterized membrane protein YdjX (TVP38/TMEM64 family)
MTFLNKFSHPQYIIDNLVGLAALYLIYLLITGLIEDVRRKKKEYRDWVNAKGVLGRIAYNYGPFIVIILSFILYLSIKNRKLYSPFSA